MAIFILPTTGNTAYRGKYPNRARSISGTAGRGTGRHIELMDGTRLWSGDDKTPEYSCGALSDDYSKVRASAVPMSAAQYATLREAAELSRSVVGIAGHGRRARIDEGVRALVESIKPDSNNYAKRNAETARRATLAGETGRGFIAERPYRVRNKTPQFSGSFDFATLAEARDYLTAQLARRDCVVSGAAPVGPDSNSQCPLESFILWADGTETIGDMGWTPPADGSASRRWTPPAPVSPATAEPERAPLKLSGFPKPETAAPVRRDNVEYHAGKAARLAGGTLDDCPYSDGGERAERWTLGWTEAAPVQTIDMTPTWSAILPALLAALIDGTAVGQGMARKELARMAEIADSYVAAQKALKDA